MSDLSVRELMTASPELELGRSAVGTESETEKLARAVRMFICVVGATVAVIGLVFFPALFLPGVQSTRSEKTAVFLCFVFAVCALVVFTVSNRNRA